MNGRIQLLDSFSVNLYQYDLFGEISDTQDYTSLFDLLETAESTDSVLLRISSPGGHLDVGKYIINAIQNSKAYCMAHIFTPSASMASLIALSCDTLTFDKHTTLMFHAPSSGIEGYFSHMHNYTGIAGDQLKNQTIDWMYPFYSKKEIDKMWHGHEMYISDTDPSLEKRIERHFKNRKK